MTRLIGILLAVLFYGGIANAKIPNGSGTTYYVGTTGCNDSGAGTSQAAPWCTVTKVNSFTFSCGDSLLFQGGASFTFTVAVFIARTIDTGGKFTANCSALAPFTIGSYGGGRATITNATTDAIRTWNMGGIMIRDLILVGSGSSTNTQNGIWADANNDAVTKYDFIYINNVDISGFRAGISIGGDNGTSGFTNAMLLNSSLHGNTDNNFIAYGTLAAPNYAHANVSVYKTAAFGTPGRASQTFPTGNGILFGGVLGGTMMNSVAHDNGTLDTFGSSACWTYDSKNVTMAFMECYNQLHANTTDGNCAAFDLGSSENLIEYSFFHGCVGAGVNLVRLSTSLVWFNNTVRYSIAELNNLGGVNSGAITCASTNTTPQINIYGNTLVASGAANSALKCSPSGNTGNVANNIFVTQSSAVAIDTSGGNPVGVQFTGNDYFGSTTVKWNSVTYSTIALWRAAIAGQEQYRGVNTDLSVDPLLTNVGGGGTCFTSGIPTGPQPCPTAYNLLAGSPMLNAGQNMLKQFGISPGTRDYYGNIVPAPSNGNYDVGANQRTQ